MKKATFLMTTLMSVTILGAPLVNAAEANVGPTALDTNATVSFKAEEPGAIDPENPLEPEAPGGGGVVDPTDPENPEGQPGGQTPEQSGPLMIEFAPNFDFGQDHEIKAEAMSFSAINKNTLKEDSAKYVNHFVQVKDTRGGSKGWNLSVKATPLKNNTGDTLSDTKIVIDNSVAYGVAGATLSADAEFKTITFDGNETAVMSAVKGEGGGRWWKSLASESTNEAKLNKEVHLDIPATDAAKISESEYTSTLTWEIVGLSDSTLSATPKA